MRVQLCNPERWWATRLPAADPASWSNWDVPGRANFM